MKMQQGGRSPFVLCVVVQTVIFGLGNVITKFAYESVTPLWCMVLRFGLARMRCWKKPASILR